VLCGAVTPSASLRRPGKRLANRRDDSGHRGEHPKHRQPTAVHDHVSVDQDADLAIPPVDHLDVGLEFPP
jgi:hypothetical protein